MPGGAFYVFPTSPIGLSSKEFATRLLMEEQVAAVPGTAFRRKRGGFPALLLCHGLRSNQGSLQPHGALRQDTLLTRSSHELRPGVPENEGVCGAVRGIHGIHPPLALRRPFLEWDHPAAAWWRRAPEQWLYPSQAVVCFILFLWWRKSVDWDWKGKPAAWGILFGVLGILCWLAPTMAADRLPGGPDAWFGHPEWPWYRYLLGIDARPED